MSSAVVRAFGDPVGRLLKPVSAKLQVPSRVECRADSAGPGATEL